MTGMDFMIHGIYSYEFSGETVWITTSHVCVLIVLLVLLGFALAANRKIRRAARELSDREAPGGMVNFLELLVEKLDDMVEHAMGIHAPAFVNYIGTVFLFLLCSNVSGLFGLRPPTADYGTTPGIGPDDVRADMDSENPASAPGRIWGELCSPLPSWLPLWVPVNLISELAIPISPVLEAVLPTCCPGPSCLRWSMGCSGRSLLCVAGRLLFTRTSTCFPGDTDPRLLYADHDLYRPLLWRGSTGIITFRREDNEYFRTRSDFSLLRHRRRAGSHRGNRPGNRTGHCRRSRGCGSGAESGRAGQNHVHYAFGTGGSGRPPTIRFAGRHAAAVWTAAAVGRTAGTMTRLFDLDMQLVHDTLLMALSVGALFLALSYRCS